MTDVTGRPTQLRELDLENFFTPKTVVVIGASDTPNRPNTAMWRKLRRKVEAGGATVYPVNPNRETVDDVPCYPSINEVPLDDIDLTVILVGNVLEVIPDVIAKGSKYAVVFAADFAETGEEGERRQAELERMIKASNTRLLGPNTNMNAFEFFRDDLPGQAIVLVTQSGHQGRPVFQGQELGIRLSHWAPVGNEVDLEFADFAAWFAQQPDVGAIAAYVEGFKDGRTVQLALDRCAREKVPVVAVKVGRTAEGQSMAKAHTGHLTGADAVIDGVFKQYGVTRVDGLDELLDVAASFARTKPPSGNGVCIYSISGGTGAHMADLCAAAGLNLVTLTDETQRTLREHIPGYLRVSNPVDSGGAPSGDKRGRPILDAILADPNVSALVVPITGALEMGNKLAKDLVWKFQQSDKPIFVVWGSPVGTEEAYTEVLLPSGIPVFRTFANCVRAVRAYFDWHEFAAGYDSPFADVPTQPLPAKEQARQFLTGDALSEHASKQVLAAYDIPVTRDVLATSAAEATKAAAALEAPAVLKICSPDILHKSDVGLVRVGLTSPADVEAAYDELMARAAAVAPGARIEGVLVSELVDAGVDLVIGVSSDPLFGPVVMVGFGGLFVEVLGDVTHRVPPFSRDEAFRMLHELKGAKLLEGVRGKPPVHKEAVVDVLMKVQRLAMDFADEISELDINPLVAGPAGAVAVDALVVTRSAP